MCLSSLKASRDKVRSKRRCDLEQQLGKLDVEHKICPQRDYLQQIQQITDTLKLLDVHQISRSIIYGRQKVFEFRDKPGWTLARFSQLTMEVRRPQT